MNIRKLINVVVISVSVLCVPSFAIAESNIVSLDELLKLVQQGRVSDGKENQERLRRFKRDKAQQASLLAQIKQEKINEDRRAYLEEARSQEASD